jgi:hypothetical protein
VGVAKNLYVGVNANIVGTLDVTGTTTLTNPVINNIKLGYTTTVTAAGTTTLTSASNYQQFFTGTTTQTIVLPVTSTLALGMGYSIENNSTGTLTVQSSGLYRCIKTMYYTSKTYFAVLSSAVLSEHLLLLWV